MSRLYRRFLADQNGATAIEYGLLAGLISIAIITGLTAFSAAGTGVFDRVITSVSAALGASSGDAG